MSNKPTKVSVRVTLANEVAEIERELKMRERVFPNWVKNGKMTQAQAEHRIACTVATLERLKLLLHNESIEQPTLF